VRWDTVVMVGATLAVALGAGALRFLSLVPLTPMEQATTPTEYALIDVLTSAEVCYNNEGRLILLRICLNPFQHPMKSHEMEREDKPCKTWNYAQRK
jgi:hypothetical protein